MVACFRVVGISGLRGRVARMSLGGPSAARHHGRHGGGHRPADLARAARRDPSRRPGERGLTAAAERARASVRRPGGVARQRDRPRWRCRRDAADLAGLRQRLPVSRTAGWCWTAIRSSSRSRSDCTTTLHGEPGDGGPLGPSERAALRVGAPRPTSQSWSTSVSPGDIVLLHDPQTAGLAAGLRELGARVVWRCHIGRDRPNDLTRVAWEFLRPYLGACARRWCSPGGSTHRSGSTTSGWSSSRRRSTRSPSRTCHFRPRSSPPRWSGWGSWPTAVGRVRSTSSGGTAAPGRCGPIAAREGSCSAATRLRSTYRWWSR